MSIFGWSYPAGAENDHNAPWNQDWDEDMPNDDGEFMAWCGLRFATGDGKSNHEKHCKACRWEYDCERADLMRDERKDAE